MNARPRGSRVLRRSGAAILAIALGVTTAHATNATALNLRAAKGRREAGCLDGDWHRAALENPRCTTGARYSAYGRFDSAVVVEARSA